MNIDFNTNFLFFPELDLNKLRNVILDKIKTLQGFAGDVPKVERFELDKIKTGIVVRFYFDKTYRYVSPNGQPQFVPSMAFEVTNELMEKEGILHG